MGQTSVCKRCKYSTICQHYLPDGGIMEECLYLDEMRKKDGKKKSKKKKPTD